MGFLDSLLGRTKPPQADLDVLFAVPQAAISLQTEGFTATGTGSVCFRDVEGTADDAVLAEAEQLIVSTPGSTVDRGRGLPRRDLVREAGAGRPVDRVVELMVVGVHGALPRSTGRCQGRLRCCHRRAAVTGASRPVDRAPAAARPGTGCAAHDAPSRRTARTR